MNKIRVIDLLNKIAKGETPTKVKYKNEIYEINALENYYSLKNGDGLFGWIFDKLNDSDALDEEVEIIEENKKIEKIERVTNDQYIGWSNNERVLVKDIIELQNKVDELIDEVNKLKEEK